MEQLMYRCTAYWIIIFNQNNKSYPQILILNLCQSVKVDGGYNQNIHRSQDPFPRICIGSKCQEA